jgi:hypothetical protein
MMHAAVPHARCGPHIIEVDLTDLNDSAPVTFVGQRFSLDTASSFSDDRPDDDLAVESEFKLPPRVHEASPIQCHAYP